MRKLLMFLFSALALAALSYDIWNGPMQGADFVFSSTGELWFTYHRDTWLGVQPFVQKNLSPEAWDQFLLPVLTLPTVLLMGGIAFFFYLISPRRKNTGRDGLMFPKRKR